MGDQNQENIADQADTTTSREAVQSTDHKETTEKTEPEKAEPEKAEAKTADADKSEAEPAADEPDEDLIPVDLNEPEKKPETEEAHHEGRPVRRREKKAVEPERKKAADPYKKKRIRKRIILLVVLALLVGAGFLLYFRVIKPAKETAEAMMNSMKETTDTVEVRDITNSITTTGILEAGDVRTITSTAKDPTIDAVFADVGDHVNKGDTLVIFSTETINRTIEQLKEDLSEARRLQSVESRASDRSYLYTYTDQANQMLNQSEKVEQALKDLYEACDGYGDAKRELQAAKDDPDRQGEIEYLETQVSSAYQKEQQAQNNYNSAVTAQAQLVGASGNTLTKADEDHEIAAIKAGDQARQYQRQIEDYQDKLENYIITAPISGMVTLVDVEEGNGFAGGRVMVIQDTDTMKIVAKIDEYDIPSVKLGQRVVIKTDATRDDELDGYVSFIAPTSTTMAAGATTTTTTAAQSTGNVDYEVTITVQSSDPRLKIGMSAKLNIIIDKVANVMTVPYDAIQTDAQGGFYVTVVDENASKAGPAGVSDAPAKEGMPVLQINGEDVNSDAPDQKPDAAGSKGFGKPDMTQQANRRNIPVEIGMEGDYYTQIISDEIQPGMTVVIPDSGEFDMSQLEEMFGPGF